MLVAVLFGEWCIYRLSIKWCYFVFVLIFILMVRSLWYEDYWVVSDNWLLLWRERHPSSTRTTSTAFANNLDSTRDSSSANWSSKSMETSRSKAWESASLSSSKQHKSSTKMDLPTSPKSKRKMSKEKAAKKSTLKSQWNWPRAKTSINSPKDSPSKNDHPPKLSLLLATYAAIVVFC